jgi:hypothetical protein
MSGRLGFPEPSLDHLARLSDGVGIFEHARGIEPRRELGYCTDDVARALFVVLAAPDDVESAPLVHIYLEFVCLAQRPGGRFRNRRLRPDGTWLDDVGPDDTTGRSVRALAAASLSASTPAARARARTAYDRAASFESPWPRSNASLVLGAVDLLRGNPADLVAPAQLERSMRQLGTAAQGEWPWPEPRLTYENALLPHARIAAAAMLEDDRMLDEGLRLLEWLVAVQTVGTHFSFVPAAGRSAAETPPGFDQQPIEAAAMALACECAYEVTGEERWALRCERAAEWFLGRNDSKVVLFDPLSGGCHDGLTPSGSNDNEGAESTISMIAAFQAVRRVQTAARRAADSSSISTVAAPT